MERTYHSIESEFDRKEARYLFIISIAMEICSMGLGEPIYTQNILHGNGVSVISLEKRINSIFPGCEIFSLTEIQDALEMFYHCGGLNRLIYKSKTLYCLRFEGAPM